MRDFYTKENMQGAAFHVPDAGLVFEPEKLAFEVETDTGREGVIRVRHRAGKPARGYVYPSESCMRNVREQFAPAADGTGYIRWQFDARGIAPGRTVRGSFRVLSPYGEYTIPYSVEIVEKGGLLRKQPIAQKNTVLRRGGAAVPAGVRAQAQQTVPLIREETETEQAQAGKPAPRSKEEFLALAEEDFAQAVSFFYSSHMEGILASGEEQTLYRGLSMQEGNLQNVEEFLVAACGKEKVLYEPVEKTLVLQTSAGNGSAEGRLAGTRAERALEAHRQRVRNRGMNPEPARREKSREEELVYLPLRIRQTGNSAIGPVIRAEGRFLPADPFPVPFAAAEGRTEDSSGSPEGKQEKVRTVRIPVNRAALHAGKNLGRVIVQGPFHEVEVPVEVYCRANAVEMRRRQGRELELLELQLMRLYVDVRLETAHSDEWFLQADRLIDEISLRSHRDLIPRLYGVHLLILRGQNAEAERELGRIAVRYAGTDAAQNFSARFTKEPEDAYCYRQYLYARCREEDRQLRSRVVRFLHGVYRQTGGWRNAWMLLDLAEEYAPGTSARWNFLRHQFESGCNSPVIWIEAWEMVREDPQILLPGSSVQERWARDDFGLHVLWYAARNGVLTPKAVEVMTALAEKKKTFSGILYRGLCAAYEMAEDPETRREILRAVCILLVRGQDVSAQAHRWYARAMEAGISLTRLEENWRQSIPADDSRYRLPAGRNAILRTTARRAVRAVLVYDRFRQEQVFPIRDGISFLSVYGDANTVFLEDAEGNRYAKSLPYALDVQETEQETADPYELAVRIGFGERGAVRLQTREEGPESYGIRGAGLLLDSGLLTSAARTQLLLACLEAADGQPELQQFFLEKAEPSQCTAQERAGLYERLAGAGAFGQAFRWLKAYGTEEAGAQLLGRLCLGIDWEGSALTAVVPAAWDAFARGNRDAGLLGRLSEAFSGLSSELLSLRKACADAGLSTTKLDDRIIRQALYTGAVEREHAVILVSTGRKLQEIFLPAVAQYADYAFSTGILMGNRMTELVAGLILGGTEGTGPAASAQDKSEIPDICRIACLKELSMRQGEISGRERAAARASLSALLSKGIIFPFYRQFPGYDDRLDLYAEETLVQYHPAEPDDGRGRRIVFHYTTSRRGEAGNYRARPMKEMYRDFYVSGFLLFYGEQMRYYITDDAAEKHVVQSGTIGQDARILEACSGRFGLINETTRAAALREYDEALSLLTGYYRRSYLESELFRR